MNEYIAEEFELLSIRREGDRLALDPKTRPVIAEISLKILINGEEYASLLCTHQYPEELAMGFLFSEGVISAMADVEKIYFYERLFTVVVKLREGIALEPQPAMRSMTSGCGRCFTAISPLQTLLQPVPIEARFSLDEILRQAQSFNEQGPIYREIGGVHSALYADDHGQILTEDIGRHNCVDKIAGLLLRQGRLGDSGSATIYLSGRVSSEIMTKLIRLQVPVLVSRSTPTATAVKLAREYNVTLLGYVRGESGVVYSASERLLL